jgi:hypothetical protein
MNLVNVLVETLEQVPKLFVLVHIVDQRVSGVEDNILILPVGEMLRRVRSSEVAVFR